MIAVLTLAVFLGLPFWPGNRAVSAEWTDIGLQFIFWRSFGFGELARGNLALWNPSVFSGSPFMGGFQSALLYPPNWLPHLLLPLDNAISLEAALHVFLGGFFLQRWARRRGIAEFPALAAAAIYMLSGPVFLRVYGGHITMADALAWTPAILLCAEALAGGAARAPWFLALAGAVALQVLAGHPQTVFNTAIAASFFLVLSRAVRRIPPRRSAEILALWAAAYAAGAALSAWQWMTGLSVAADSTRGGAGLDRGAAGFFSLPPENLLTLLAPGFFGTGLARADGQGVHYWGKTFMWEVVLYFGVAGLLLAGWGAIRRRGRGAGIPLAASAFILVLALGRHTPLFALLHGAVPGFNRFRGPAKFASVAMPFLALLAGYGIEAAMEAGGDGLRRLAVFAGGLALLLFLAAGAVFASSRSAPEGWWNRAVAAEGRTEESYGLPLDGPPDPAFVKKAGAKAAGSLLIAAALAGAAAGLAYAGKPRLLAGLAVAEVFVFALAQFSSFEAEKWLRPEHLTAFKADASPGEDRLFQPQGNDNEMIGAGLRGVWGYDPNVSRRYSELIHLSQGMDPAKAEDAIAFQGYGPLLRLVRTRYVLTPSGDSVEIHLAPNPPLPRALLCGEFEVIPDAAARWARLADPSFDPERIVILDTEPAPRPEPGGPPGEIRIEDLDTDTMIVEVKTPMPRLLLLTDAFATGWNASDLSGQGRNYSMIPADHALRAIPLAAGEHRIRLEYRPWGFSAGRAVTLASLLAFAAAAVRVIRRRRNGMPGAAME